MKEETDESAAKSSKVKLRTGSCLQCESLRVNFLNIEKLTYTHKKGQSRQCEMTCIHRSANGR